MLVCDGTQTLGFRDRDHLWDLVLPRRARVQRSARAHRSLFRRRPRDLCTLLDDATVCCSTPGRLGVEK
jgi:hypothetical protein